MNDEHNSPDFEGLERPLQAAVRATLAAPVPEDSVDRVKLRAKQLATSDVSPSGSSTSVRRGWNAVRLGLAGLTAAAALVAVMIAGSALLDHTGSRAFAEMIEKVKTAASVRLSMTTRFGPGPETHGSLYLEGDRLRQEQFDRALVLIGDFQQKKALFLNMPRKIAQTEEISAAMARGFTNPIEQLRRATADDAKQIGEEALRGRRTRVYRLGKVDLLGMKGPAEGLVWVDVASGLPAKIVIRDTDPKAESEIRFDDFAWNEPLAPRLFSLSIPDGFHKGVIAIEPRSPQSGPSPATTPDSSGLLADGTISRDRVPARIIWVSPGSTITALMRDPESVAPMKQQPNELRQWDVKTGKLRWSEPIHGAGSLAGSADGKRLATIIGYEIELRDAASGKIMRKWSTDQPLSPVAFSPDGKLLAAGITEWGPYGGKGGKMSGGAQIWDTQSAGLVRTVLDDKPVTFVTFSADGKTLASSSNDGPIKLWNAATGELTSIVPGCGRAAFSPDGKTIACPIIDPSADKTTGHVGLFKTRDGSLVRSFASEKGMSASWLLSVAFSPDGRLLAAADWNGTVTLWQTSSGKREMSIADHKGGVHAVVFSPDGASLATGSEDKILRLQAIPTQLIQPAPEKK